MTVERENSPLWIAAEKQGIAEVCRLLESRGIPCELFQSGGWVMLGVVPLIMGEGGDHYLTFAEERNTIVLVSEHDRRGDYRRSDYWGSFQNADNSAEILADRVCELWLWFKSWRNSFATADGEERERCAEQIGEEFSRYIANEKDGACYGFREGKYFTNVGNLGGIETESENEAIAYLWENFSRFHASEACSGATFKLEEIA